MYPDLPADLSIGDQIVNWGGDAAFSGEFRAEDNVVRDIQPGGVKVVLHKNGIQVLSSFFTPYLKLHSAQIINTRFADTSELLKQDKSVIGRAVVGGLLMGPLGAVIGGASGIGKKDAKNNSFLVINYWDKGTRQAQTILIRGKDKEIRLFVGRMNSERAKQQAIADGTPVPSSGCMVVLAIPFAGWVTYELLQLVV